MLDMAFCEDSGIWPFEGGTRIERGPAGLLPFFRERVVIGVLELIFDGVCLLLLVVRAEAESDLYLAKPSVRVEMMIL